ncbi:ABC transporter permease [Lysinibacillus sp. 2017]|uniref:FecCD family ABC transporter permease n=1 Tax=unclassified Lysinibacillus TaxID=2636778 RepID=UPI000D527645|nr:MULTISPECIES: iron ABC transporter permease [unclassified Lysinibacillus]AWE09213.1 ABC transporter permease [Lysinibacillus sp. 2017]TGN30594.1 iron ABC transporter permease [Lysinibacillus sp. S2017]
MTKKIISFVAIAILLFVTIVYASTTGSIKMSFIEFITSLFDANNDKMAAIKDLRFPRIIVAIFAGAALSVAGVLLQAIMRNPLADAGFIGISAGAAFTKLFIISFVPTMFFFSPIAAFIGGAFACFLVFLLSWKSGLNPLKLILVGIAINAMFSGLTEAMINFGASSSGSITSNLTLKTWDDVSLIATYGTIGLVLAFVLYSWCNVLVLSDKTAKSVGFNVMWARILIAIVAVMLAASSVVVAGVISFVGILVPHIARRLVGYDHKVLIPFTALLGALLILLADTLGRTMFSPMEIPASTIMAIIGGPFLIFLLRKE